MRGIVFVDDRSAVHVIPRAEVRHVEIVALDSEADLPDDWALNYQLAGGIVRSVEWKGESRPESLKDKIDVGVYNQIAARGLLTMITRGHRDIHLERRADNVFLLRSGLVEDDAHVVLCRQLVVEMVSRLGLESLDDWRQKLLHEILDAARDLKLPDWYPLRDLEEPR